MLKFRTSGPRMIESRSWANEIPLIDLKLFSQEVLLARAEQTAGRLVETSLMTPSRSSTISESFMVAMICGAAMAGVTVTSS